MKFAWVTWRGNERPVAPGQWVKILWRHSQKIETLRACDVAWGDDDIAAYRLADPPQKKFPSEPTFKDTVSPEDKIKKLEDRIEDAMDKLTEKVARAIFDAQDWWVGPKRSVGCQQRRIND